MEKYYREHKAEIYRYFHRLTLDKGISEDLTQDTFIKAYKGWNKFKGRSTVRTWLFRIAVNTYRNYMRKTKEFLTEPVHSLRPQMDEQLIIQDTLSQMSEKERSLIVLRHINDLAYKDISQILNLTEGQVKVGLYRARKKFREIYQGRDD